MHFGIMIWALLMVSACEHTCVTCIESFAGIAAGNSNIRPLSSCPFLWFLNIRYTQLMSMVVLLC